MTVYTSVITSDSVLNATSLNVGDYITSPSHVYYAALEPSGQFVVSRGSDPTTSGSHPVWQTAAPTQQLVQSPLAVLFPDGEFGVYGTDPTSSPFFGIRGGGNNSLGATLALNDTGTLTIHEGIAPVVTGRQTFSNGFNDPAVSYELKGLDYNLSSATVKTSANVDGGTFPAVNQTATPQIFLPGLEIQYTRTSSWDFSVSEAITAGVKTESSVGIPGLGQSKLEISLTETTTITKGKGESESTAKTYKDDAQVLVPPFTTYQTTLTGQTATFDVPFTYNGLVGYRSGNTALARATGVFSGGDTGVFSATITCVSAPSGCPTSPETPVPVPETSSLTLVPVAMLATAICRRMASTRRGRSAGR